MGFKFRLARNMQNATTSSNTSKVLVAAGAVMVLLWFTTGSQGFASENGGGTNLPQLKREPEALPAPGSFEARISQLEHQLQLVTAYVTTNPASIEQVKHLVGRRQGQVTQMRALRGRCVDVLVAPSSFVA